MTGDYATAVLIAHAAIPARKVYGRRIRASTLKAVLHAVWAHEGRQVSAEQLADCAGLGCHVVRFSLAAMVEHGLVSRRRVRCGPSVYHINKPALARLQPPGPRSTTPRRSAA